ncbi:MAG TPA: FHA domain-containing protein [Acidimicrobiia bacterium]|nr:FHA domain-containing protein [Acidimicrobiia bacterium]
MRQLERKLEAVLERSVGQVFRGTAHVSELAGSLVRVLDLSVDSDGLVPNRILVPATVPAESVPALESTIAEAISERGWRIEGPVTVVPSDVRSVTVTIERGPLPAWATLEGPGRPALRVNRAVIGRSAACDVVIDDASVSRRHARVWRQDDRVLCVDLGSSNGTTVDGEPVGSSPIEVRDGSVLAFGAARFQFRQGRDA